MSVSMRWNPSRRSLVLAMRKPPVWSASWPRPLCGSARSRSSFFSRAIIIGRSVTSARRVPSQRHGAGLVDAVPGLLGRALGAQAGGVHRIDADVGAIGRVDHRLEPRLDVGRDGQALREEHHALAARDGPHRADDRQQRVGGGVALLVPLERLERLGHPALDRGELRVGGGAADVRRRAALAGAAGHAVRARCCCAMQLLRPTATPAARCVLKLDVARPPAVRMAARIASASRVNCWWKISDRSMPKTATTLFETLPWPMYWLRGVEGQRRGRRRTGDRTPARAPRAPSSRRRRAGSPGAAGGGRRPRRRGVTGGLLTAVNEPRSCGTPSSEIWKSSAVRPVDRVALLVADDHVDDDGGDVASRRPRRRVARAAAGPPATVPAAQSRTIRDEAKKGSAHVSGLGVTAARRRVERNAADRLAAGARLAERLSSRRNSCLRLFGVGGAAGAPVGRASAKCMIGLSGRELHAGLELASWPPATSPVSSSAWPSACGATKSVGASAAPSLAHGSASCVLAACGCRRRRSAAWRRCSAATPSARAGRPRSPSRAARPAGRRRRRSARSACPDSGRPAARRRLRAPAIRRAAWK